jgi:hypothetical protein
MGLQVCSVLDLFLTAVYSTPDYSLLVSCYINGARECDFRLWSILFSL